MKKVIFILATVCAFALISCNQPVGSDAVAANISSSGSSVETPNEGNGGDDVVVENIVISNFRHSVYVDGVIDGTYNIWRKFFPNSPNQKWSDTWNGPFYRLEQKYIGVEAEGGKVVSIEFVATPKNPKKSFVIDGNGNIEPPVENSADGNVFVLAAKKFGEWELDADTIDASAEKNANLYRAGGNDEPLFYFTEAGRYDVTITAIGEQGQRSNSLYAEIEVR